MALAAEAGVGAAVPRAVPIEKPPVLAAGALKWQKEVISVTLSQYFHDTSQKANCEARNNLSLPH